MGPPRELEIEDDPRFQRREWRLQHLGWWMLSLLIGASVLGVFGSGPLSETRAGEPGTALWLEYDRFVRVGAPNRISVHLGAAPAERPVREVRFDRAYFDSLRINRITPEPQHVEVDGDDARLLFAVEPTSRETIVVFDVEPLVAGRRTGRVSTRQQQVLLRQFAYF